MEYLKTHLAYVILMAAGLLGFRAWLAEHDSRMLAESLVKESQAKVEQLNHQMDQASSLAKAQAEAIRARIQAVKTPEQAVREIPLLQDFPLNQRPLPPQGLSVEVDAVPLAQQLGKCKEDAVMLQACQANALAQAEVVRQKDLQVKAMSKKRGFWKRVLWGLKAAAIGAAAVEGLRIAGGRP